MASSHREAHSAESIQAEVRRLVTSSPDYEPENPRFAVGSPFPLQGRDELGANWTMALPGTAFQTPLVAAAIADVAKRWDLAG